MHTEHPAAHLESSVAQLRQRATLALVALGAVILARSWDIAVREWSVLLIRSIPAGEDAEPELIARLEHADGLVSAGNIAIAISFLATAVTFLFWVHRVVALTRALGGALAWTPGEAVWGFFIPFVSLVRPYQVLSATHAALAPEQIAPPAPRVDPTRQVDYRSAAFVEPSPARHVPAALIPVWWGAFIVLGISARIASIASTSSTVEAVVSAYRGSVFVSVLAIITAGLAVTVVRGLTARAEERFRRIRESYPESLTEQGITLGAGGR